MRSWKTRADKICAQVGVISPVTTYLLSGVLRKNSYSEVGLPYIGIKHPSSGKL
jgi:hypothetical protein